MARRRPTRQGGAAKELRIIGMGQDYQDFLRRFPGVWRRLNRLAGDWGEWNCWGCLVWDWTIFVCHGAFSLVFSC